MNLPHVSFSFWKWIMPNFFLSWIVKYCWGSIGFQPDAKHFAIPDGFCKLRTYQILTVIKMFHTYFRMFTQHEFCVADAVLKFPYSIDLSNIFVSSDQL